MIPYARQSISQEDIDAVVDALRSEWLTQGPAVPRFEGALAGYAGARFAVAVSSATAALHLACRAVGLGAGDWLWTSPNTFVASANCAKYCGAQVDFVDIDPVTCNISVPGLERKLEAARREGRLPKVLMCVHFGGRPCDMPAIAGLARRHGIRVVEDASHALGAEHESGKVGDCAHSDIAVWSFHPVKIITTGEGGAVLTNDEALAKRIRLLRTHGITRDPGEMRGRPEGPWYYEQIDLGFNYRMTDIQAALGASQLSRVDDFVARRRHLANRYMKRLDSFPLQLPAADGRTRSSWHLYVIQLKLEAIRATRKALVEQLRARGIMVNVHYIPVHLQPYYRSLGFRRGDYPEAEGFYERAITLPLFPDLTEAQQDQVCEALGELLRE